MPTPEHPTVEPAGVDDSRARAGRRQLLLLGLMFLAPVVAAYIAYLMPPSGRANHGDLIDPQRDVAGFALAPVPGVSGSVEPGATLAALGGRWVFVVSACRERLYEIRQLRLTTGEDRDRVERLWIVTDEDRPADALLAGHEGLRVARADPREFAAAFPAGGDGDPTAPIYLVDPLGHLMMRFPADIDPSLIKKDLRRLLKVSRIG
jgi:hypothetical protein